MRKITTLLAIGAALCSSAFAVVLPGTKIDTDNLRLSPEGIQMVNQMQAQQALGMQMENDGMNKVMAKSMIQGNFKWAISFNVNVGVKWCDVLIATDPNTGEEKKISFKDFPFYMVYYNLSAERISDKKQVTAINIPLCWPSMYIWEQTKTQFATGVDIPDDEIDETMVTMNQMFEATAADKLGKSFWYTGTNNVYYGDDEKTFTDFYPMAPNAWAGEKGWTQYVNGVNTVLVEDQNKISQLTLASCDLDIETYKVENTLFFETGNPVNLVYDGTLRDNGFRVKSYEYEITHEPHLVNIGIESAELLGMDNVYTSETWGPFRKWWFIAGLGDCDPILRQGQTKWNKEWSTVFGVVDNEGSDDSFCFLATDLFTKEDATAPYGWYDVCDVNAEYNDKNIFIGSDAEPRLNQLLPSGYNEAYMPWSDLNEGDCLVFVNGGYYTFMQPYTRLVLGDKEKGIWFIGEDNYHNKFSIAKYTGDIILHNNPDNLEETKTISAVSDIVGVEAVEAASDVLILSDNGKITVAAAEDVEAAVYTISGTLIAKANVKANNFEVFNPGKGIYVVKAGNVAKKVVL